MSASVRTARRSARTIFPASSGASAAARSAVHPVSRSAAFGRDAPAPAGLFPQADSGMARSFGYRHDRKRLRARAVCGEGVYRQERDSDHRNLRDARLFQLFGVRDFSEKFGKGNAFFEIAGLTVEIDYFACNLKKILALVLAFALRVHHVCRCGVHGSGRHQGRE